MKFIAQRKIVTIETVKVEAKNVMEAFIKAGEDIDCEVIAENEGDYEPIYESVAKLNYEAQKR